MLISTETYSHLVHASAHMEEAVKCSVAHYLAPLAAMSHPQPPKTDNATSYRSSAFENVCAQHKIAHNVDILEHMHTGP